MEGELPKRAGDLEVHEADDGLVVYELATDRVHRLNHTAAAILELCDGTRTPPEIAETVKRLFTLPQAPLEEIRRCIDDLRHEGLVT